MTARLTACLGLLFAVAVHAGDTSPDGRHIYGWVEWVELHEPTVRLRAKLDTGATTSSLNAINKERFQRDGAEWVAFDVVDPEDEDNLIRFEREIVRNVRILRAGGEMHPRPVVKIGMCVGDVYREGQFTLADRSDLNYQVLVGRNFMADRIIVDSAETYTQRPRCQSEKTGGEEDDAADETTPDQ